MPIMGYTYNNLSGLGDATQIVSTVGSSAATVASVPAVGGAIAGGLGMASWAIPIIGPVIGGITLGIMAFLNRKSAKQKVASTAIVNEFEPHLVDNLNAYLNSNHYASQQAQALANFDALWNQMVRMIQSSDLGGPGERAIQERGPTGTPSWGKNWFQLYRDPIANDPKVKADPTVTQEMVNNVQGIFSQLTGGVGGGGRLLSGSGLLIVGLMAVALMWNSK